MTCYSCGNPRRLLAVRLAGVANAIDYLEVRDHDEPSTALRQRTLFVHLLLPVAATLGADAVVIDGGERVTRVAVEWAKAATGLTAAEQAAMLPDATDLDRILVVRTADRGDFSLYRFAIVVPGTDDPPADFDPLLAAVPFSFKVECPSDLDCDAPCTCPPGIHHPPPIDYLAKDYLGFRRIMLERMALLAPEWTERSAADVGVTLVDLLAYVADELSYRQDAVSTEAYLNTARSRISLRRHARLVDYRVHDGCNARAWVRVRVTNGTTALPLGAGTTLLSRIPDIPARIPPGSRLHEDAIATRPVVFETVERTLLHDDLDELRFWTWGREDAKLSAGATRATLRGRHRALRPGDVLVLAETVSPQSIELDDPAAALEPGDTDHRWAVRLVDVRPSKDPAGLLFDDGVEDVTEITWHPDDALPEGLCLAVDGIETAVAWGNIVLADHGQSVRADALGTVPAPHLTRIGPDCDDRPTPVPPRFRSTLPQRPLTRTVARAREVVTETPLTAAILAELAAGSVGNAVQALFDGIGVVIADNAPIGGLDGLYGLTAEGGAWMLRDSGTGTLEVLSDAGSAAAALAATPRDGRPAIVLDGVEGAGTFEWSPLADLVASSGEERVFVAEVESDGTAVLRFGDDEHGARPTPGTAFGARYRVGNGRPGNVGRDALAHVVSASEEIFWVGNPLPAAGGVDAETMAEIRRDAPANLAVQERAVTAPDYEQMALRTRSVEKAAATFRWTGSWHTVFVTADRTGGSRVDAPFEVLLRAGLERYRMAGYDLEVDGPRYVPLEIALHVCVARLHRRADVAAAVRDVLSNRVRTDGTLGLFHPDRFTFGQPVYLSSLLAAVHGVPGVESVDVGAFERQREPETSGLGDGVLPMGRLEIARLDNDPSFPERGVLALSYGGGS